MELILPLQTLANLAWVSRSWKKVYERRLDDNYKKLQQRALVASPADTPYAPTSLQQKVAGLKEALPVFEKPGGLTRGASIDDIIPIFGAWRQARSVPGPSASIPFREFSGQFQIRCRRLVTEIFVRWHTLDYLTLVLDVRACAMTVEGLEGRSRFCWSSLKKFCHVAVVNIVEGHSRALTSTFQACCAVSPSRQGGTCGRRWPRSWASSASLQKARSLTAQVQRSPRRRTTSAF